MDKVKRVYSYKTTDDKVFSGKDAAKRAKEHQKRVDFKNTIEKIIPEMEKIFKLEDTDEYLINKMNGELLYECDDFDDLIERFVDIYLEIPEIAKCFQLIENRVKNFK